MLKLCTTVICVLFCLIALLAFTGALAYRDALGGKIKILIPQDFIHIAKADYKTHYAGEPAPDDYYCNKDTTEEVSFMAFPQPAGNFDWCRSMMKFSFFSTANKVYFADTTSLNGNKVFVAELDIVTSGKMQHLKMIFIPMGAGTAICGMACNIKLKNDWMPVSDEMAKSLVVK